MKYLALLFVGVAFFLGVMAAVPSTKVAAVDIFTKSCSGAAADTAPCKDVERQKKSGENPVLNIIKAAITIISYVVGIAAIIGLVVSSIRLMTAGGDSNTVSAARSGIVYSLIGVAIVVLAQTLVVYVLNSVK